MITKFVRGVGILKLTGRVVRIKSSMLFSRVEKCTICSKP